MTILRLAMMSLRNRWAAALLAAMAIAVSVALFLGVEKVRTGAKTSFADTLSGTDLIVGARAGNIQLLLYSVFRIGNATNNVTMQSLEEIAALPDVAWVVPLSLGDSHRGYRVLGTSRAYFDHYRYRRDRSLEFQDGAPFEDLFDAVVGADVAAALGYRLGDPLVIEHGVGAMDNRLHDDKPFRIAGILEKTGTPVDRTVHVSMEAIEAIHIDWKDGGASNRRISAEQVRRLPLKPKSATAALVGLNGKLAIFRVQRFVNNYADEPLSAVLPGVALGELWSLVDVAETALAVVSSMVVLTAILGMVTMILTTLNERRREMAILRSVGAGPGAIFGLLSFEAGLLTVCGAAAGTAGLYAALWTLQPLIDDRFGLYLPLTPPTAAELAALGVIVFAGCLAGLGPAFKAYRLSLADGMTVRT